MKKEDYLALLKEAGYKSTKARQALISILIQSQNHFLNVDGLLRLFKEEYPEINVSTIYRNLTILEELNIIHKLLGDDGIALYKLIECHSHHHHVICQKCGKTAVINMCPLPDLDKLVEKEDFVLTDHRLELYGYCKDCNKGRR